jgi:hypothetical protein
MHTIFFVLTLSFSVFTSLMSQEAFLQEFEKEKCSLKKLSSNALRYYGELFGLKNYSLQDVRDLEKSITATARIIQVPAKRRSEEERSLLPQVISEADSVVSVIGESTLKISLSENENSHWQMRSPIRALALSRSGNKLCVGCGKNEAVEILYFMGISPCGTLFVASVCDFDYSPVPYSFLWDNSEKRITLYGRAGNEYRLISVDIPDAIFFLAHYESLKST